MPEYSRQGEDFNPRLREGGDLMMSSGMETLSISIHASAKEATPTKRQSLILTVFQSTPPRRRRLDLYRMSVDRAISIHASAKEATPDTTAQIFWLKFQSTPPRRRRPWSLATPKKLQKYFNPRLREGGDKHVSIRQVDRTDFNPRLREGGDPP